MKISFKCCSPSYKKSIYAKIVIKKIQHLNFYTVFKTYKTYTLKKHFSKKKKKVQAESWRKTFVIGIFFFFFLWEEISEKNELHLTKVSCFGRKRTNLKNSISNIRKSNTQQQCRKTLVISQKCCFRLRNFR